MRPDATFQDLREADGDTGNVEENKSLYWNPVIYKVTTVIKSCNLDRSKEDASQAELYTF